jgi:translation elongation factor P/translation initiation factor 5A
MFCQITKKKDVKVGKHGSAKHIIKGIDIFRKDKKIHEKTILGGKNVFVPNVRRDEYVLLCASDGFARLLDSNQEIREIEISDDLEDELQQLIDDTSGTQEIMVTLISHASFIHVISHRVRSY